MSVEKHVRRFHPILFGDGMAKFGCAGCGELLIPGDDVQITFAWEHLDRTSPTPYTLVHEECRVAYHKRYRSL